MDAARALADLLEIAPQVEAAALFRGGEILGAAGLDDDAAGRVAGSAERLLDAAGESRSDGTRATQVRASLRGAGVFVVREAEGEPAAAAAAVASPDATPGLVFYDLKRCLAAVAEQPPPKPRRRRATKKKEPADDA